MVANMSDEDIWRLNRVVTIQLKFMPPMRSSKHQRSSNVILAKTVKGFGLGQSGEAQNVAHNVKKMDVESIKQYRDRFNMPISDDQIEDLPFFKFEDGSPEWNTCALVAKHWVVLYLHVVSKQKSS